jgi:hypothetical protein
MELGDEGLCTGPEHPHPAVDDLDPVGEGAGAHGRELSPGGRWRRCTRCSSCECRERSRAAACWRKDADRKEEEERVRWRPCAMDE